MLAEVNPTKPFVCRQNERDAILERKESAGCVSTPAPSSRLCLYALGTAEIPPQDGGVQSDGHTGRNYAELKAQKCPNEEEKIS